MPESLKPKKKTSKKVTCRIIWDDRFGSKAVVWHLGLKKCVEKARGFDFVVGDFVCLNTNGQGSEYISPLSRTDELKIKKIIKSVGEVQIPDVTREDLKVFGIIKSVNADKTRRKQKIKTVIVVNEDTSTYRQSLQSQVLKIYEKQTKDNIKKLFDVDIKLGEDKGIIRDVFLTVASQKGEKFEKLRDKIFEKADLMIDNQYIMDGEIDKVVNFMLYHFEQIDDSEKEDAYLLKLQVFLQRLRLIQKNGEIDKDGVMDIFRRVYDEYISRFGKSKIATWMAKNSK